MDIRSFFSPGAGKAKANDKKETAQQKGRPKNNSAQKSKNPYSIDSGSKKADKKHDDKPVVIETDSENDDIINSSLSKSKKDDSKKAKRTSLKTYGKDKSQSKSFSEIVNNDSDFEIDSNHSSNEDDSKNTNSKNKKSKSSMKNRSADSGKKSQKRKLSSDEETVDIISSDDEEVLATRKKGTKKGKKGAKKTHALFESDSEEDPIPKSKERSKRKKKEPVYDSDQERQKSAMNKFLTGESTSGSKKKQDKEKAAAKGKPTSVADFFGSASTKRVERPTPVVKRKLEVEKKKPTEFESEMHDDEDFLLTLDQLDGPSAKKVKTNVSNDECTEVLDKSNGGKRLSESKEKDKSDEESSKEKSPTDKNETQASKLANKIKALKDMMNQNEQKKKEIDKKRSPAKKKGHVYTMEVTKNIPSVTSPGKKEKAKEDVTPPKKVKAEKPSNTNNEDDGFGIKSVSGYGAFKARGGPLALGSKEIPEGAENCLEDLTFVITGVLDSIERDDAKSLIERYGGKVTTSLSKKTSYMIVGREPGDSKIKKAAELKTKQLDEDGLFELIRTKPGKKSKYELKAMEQIKKDEAIKDAEAKGNMIASKLESFANKTPYRKGMFNKESKENEKTVTSNSQFTQMKSVDDLRSSQKSDTVQSQTKTKESTDKSESLLWVDKHKPTTLRNIIGQQGDKSNAKKLFAWLRDWHTNIIVKKMKGGGGNYFGGAGDGKGCRAALLSGPPGIGKTTTATLVCKELGFSYVELNASDTRSKKNLKEYVAESLNNTTLVDFMGKEGQGHKQGDGRHHCIIMDEVDGMAGNEDRGGLQELVQLIKTSKIPVICICNDRNAQKMRTLSGYCLDLRFAKPRVEQIKGAMMTLAFKEGIKIPSPALNEIIQASNHDIRQVIHNLSMWSAGDKNMTFDKVKEDSQKAQKDFKMGPFDVCRKVFVDDEDTRKMTLNDKSDLFFNDYSFGPLFVHENYPSVIPKRAGGNQSRHMSCLARTMDSLSDGDLIDRYIRRDQNWGLLPMQAMYASVIPGEVMRGSFPAMPQFPQWLGKFSSTNKTERIIGELASHMRLEISADKRAMTLDYLPALKTKLTRPLTTKGSEGVQEVIQTMDDYDIIREDFDNLLEITKWTGRVDTMKALDSKTKAFFTREYNKQIHMTPYSSGVPGVKKRKARGAPMDEDMFGLEGEEGGGGAVSEEDEEKIEKAEVEAMKAKKKPAGKTKASANKGGKQSKGKR